MKIFRNGTEFELTATELRTAYQEYYISGIIEDVESEITQLKINISSDELKSIARKIDIALYKNEDYMESYWITVENCINEFVKNNQKE